MSQAGRILSERIARELGALFRDARVPIIVLLPSGAFVAVNDRFLEQYGYSLDELLALRIHDLILDERDVDEDIRIAAQTEAVPLARRRHRRKDGSVLWVVPQASQMLIGGEQYIVSILSDVTAAVLLEERAARDARKAEDLWRATSEELADGIAIMDADRRILRVNSAMLALVGLSEGELVGKTCREIFPRCTTDETCLHLRAAAAQKRTSFEFHGRLTGPRPLRVDVLPCDPGSAHFAFIHVAHDQTEERAIRSELVSADRLATIGRLSAGVAHEVNNPAALVTVNLGVLKNRFAAGVLSRSEALSILDESMEGMSRIRDIVQDLKGFARERSREKVDLSELATSAIRMAAHATRGHARVDKLLEQQVWATVRRARIAQVVLNLLMNSAEAFELRTIGEHRILVRAFHDDGRACIEVSDDGPGVPRELAERIFEPFFTTREKAGGTGLGLWLSRQIVEEEGGTLDLRKGELPGATFRVSLASA